MVLLLTHKQGFESDLIVEGLRSQNLPFARFNLDDFPIKNSIDVTFGDENHIIFRTQKRHFSAKDVKFAWMQQTYTHSFTNLIEPQRTLASQETAHFLKGVWEIANWKWMNPPFALDRNNKIRQLQQAQLHGLKIPSSLISADQPKIKAFHSLNENKTIFKNLDTPLLYKKDGSYLAAYTKHLDVELLDKYSQNLQIPILFQTELEKSFELRILIFGDCCFSVRINSQNSSSTMLDWRKNPQNAQIEMVRFDVPDSIRAKCFKLLSSLQLKFGAFDFVVTNSGEYIFLEVNSIGSWYWMELATGLNISQSLINFLESQLG